RVTLLPALEPGEGVVLLRGTRDLNERLGGDAPSGGASLFPRWGDARRLARLLGIVRRPGRVAEALGLLLRRPLEERVARPGMIVDAGMAVADAGEACRHGAEREVLRRAREQLVPRDRRRHARVGLRAHRVRPGHGAVLGVLVVVEEDAVPLLLPPLAGGDG